MLRVVIAEDQAIPRRDLREQLEACGYDVVGEAEDAETALALTQQLRPDVVVMDVVMGTMSGVEAARLMHEERLAPVLLVTAYAAQGAIDGAPEAGVAAFLAKPWNAPQLKPAIEFAIRAYAEKVRSDSEADRLREQLETRKLVDRAKGVLMDRDGLKESDAFRTLQRRAMNDRKPMRDVAEAVLLNAETPE